MLVPLDTQTLPGWPPAPNPSALHVLGLLVGAPLVVILLIAVLTRVHHAVKGNAGVPGVANAPIWVNGRRVEPSTQDGASRQAIENGYHAAGSDGTETQDDASSSEQTGGAGARW